MQQYLGNCFRKPVNGLNDLKNVFRLLQLVDVDLSMRHTMNFEPADGPFCAFHSHSVWYCL